MILNFEGKKNLESLMDEIDDIGILTNAGPVEDQVYHEMHKNYQTDEIYDAGLND